MRLAAPPRPAAAPRSPRHSATAAFARPPRPPPDDYAARRADYVALQSDAVAQRRSGAAASGRPPARRPPAPPPPALPAEPFDAEIMLLALPATLIAVPVLLRNPAVGLALALGLALVPGVGGALATLAREVGALFSPARHTPRRLRAPRGAGAAPVDWRRRPDATPLPAPRARTLPPAGRAARSRRPPPPAARAVDEACVLVWGTQDEATPACEAGARAAAAVREAAEGGWGVGVGGRLFRG